MQHKGLVAGSVTLTLAAVIGIGMMASGPGEAGPSGSSSRFPELEAVLGELRRTWKADEKAEVFAAAAARIDDLRSPLLDLLSEPPHPLMKEAVQLAASLDVREAHPAIVRLAESGPERLRPAAILAAERLQPWTREELAAFLGDDLPPILIAALDVASSSVERPFLEIIDLFGHEDPQVRRAASEAIPYELEPEILEELLAVAGNATGDRARNAIRALGRTKLVAEVETFLIQQLDVTDPSLRLAALDALGAKGSPLTRSTPVWKIALDGREDPVTQAAALYCLERTHSFTTRLIRRTLPRMGPLPRYVAARCLLTNGEKDGIAILLNLETQRRNGGFPELGPELDEGLSVAVGQLVRLVKGRGRTDDLDLLWEWYAGLSKVRLQTLPPSAFLNPTSSR